MGHCEECGDETILVALVQDFIDALDVAPILNNILMAE